MGEAEAADTDATTIEFYEFVLPPVDIRLGPSGVVVVVDVPGFRKEDISLRVSGDLLTIRAERRRGGGGAGKPVLLQRPRRLDKTVRLPVRVAEGSEAARAATCADGVLTVSLSKAGRGQPAAPE